MFKNFFKRSVKEFPGAMQILNLPISYNALNGRRLFSEGYNGNVVVYKCQTTIIRALQSIKVQLFIDGKLQDDHDALTILNRPNPVDGWSSFIKNSFVNYLSLGEMFISTSDDAQRVPTELWNFNPLEMQIKPGKGVPAVYIQKINGKEVLFPVDNVTGDSQMFFWKDFNPLDKWRGMSPLFSASLATDTNSQGLRWNHSLLKNGARGSGLITYKGTPKEDVYLSIRKWFKEQFQGARNAGEVPILVGDAKFQELGKSPKDMDFIKTIDKTTAFIAMAYGVPLPLILNDAATFSNMREAKELLYTGAVLPLYEEFLSCFGNWLLPKFGLKNAHYIMDKDSIPALEGLRDIRRKGMKELVSGGIITPNEAREELGFEPIPGGADNLFMPSFNLPIDENFVGDDDAE